MEKLARQKIALQQRLLTLKKELSVTWEHIDINSLLLENSGVDGTIVKTGKIFLIKDKRCTKITQF